MDRLLKKTSQKDCSMKDNIFFFGHFFSSISSTKSRQDLFFRRTTTHSINFKEEFALDNDDVRSNKNEIISL